MTTPEQVQELWESMSERAMHDMNVLHSRLDFAIAVARRDGLADWAIKLALETTAKDIQGECDD